MKAEKNRQKLTMKVVRKAAKFVGKLFNGHTEKGLFYHDRKHTQQVVKYARRITRKNDLTKSEKIILLLAAWFHDVGYLQQSDDRETRSSLEAERFLLSEQVDPEVISAVKKTIMATKTPQQPQTTPEKILCDADLYHFGLGTFAKRNKLLRKELQVRSGEKIKKSEWLDDSIKVLSAHNYFTAYAKHKLDKRKNKNLKTLFLQKRLAEEATAI